jgi:endonuclease/exonuclease/phosphatase family metal-dependent hydrolase
MTYNIRHGAGSQPVAQSLRGATGPPAAEQGLARVVAVVEAHQPDVVALQEVDRFWERSGGLDQPAWLASALGLHVAFGATLDHPSDDHAGQPHQYGVAVLSRYPILQSRTTPLPAAGPADERRALLEVQLEAGGARLAVYATHLQPGGGPSGAGRQGQVMTILAQIGDRRPAVLLGDFNAAPDWPEVTTLGTTMQDVWATRPADGDTTGGATFPARPDRPAARRIDYIFASRDLTVRDVAVPVDRLTRVASDHYPVVATLGLPAHFPEAGDEPARPGRA